MKGSDICQCGDFRSEHTETVHAEQVDYGKCRVCGNSRAPYDGCSRFRFSHVASVNDQRVWDAYHARRKR